MAAVEVHMTALGQQHEKCTGCDKQFERGEQMAGVAFAAGDTGWYCPLCIRQWTETGVQPEMSC